METSAETTPLFAYLPDRAAGGLHSFSCAIFFVRWAAAGHKGRFFGRNILFFLISIPYLNILDWSGADLPRYWAMLIGVMPLMRAFLALYVVVRWLVDNKIRQLFTAYIFTVVVFTYISALVFYDYEILVNDKLHGFGNALCGPG